MAIVVERACLPAAVTAEIRVEERVLQVEPRQVLLVVGVGVLGSVRQLAAAELMLQEWVLTVRQFGDLTERLA